MIKIGIKRKEAEMLRAVAFLARMKAEYESIIRELIHVIEREMVRDK